MKINKILKGLLLLVLSLGFTVNTFASFYISIDNGYAGKSSILTTSNIGKNIDAKISIEKPGGEKIFINEKSGNDGKINSEILGYHTKKIGKYNLDIELKNGTFSKTSFVINSGKFSLRKSEIFSSEKSIAAKIDTTDITAIIVDNYGNPIKGHKIKIFSSRNEDVFINGNECTTNINGKCIFKIKSKKEGKSIFTAINLSENITLNQRVPVIFYTEEEKFAIGGNPFMASLLSVNDGSNLLDSSDNFGVINGFKIETSDEIVLNSDDNTMTISAIDENGNVVSDYLGEVQMSIPDDENALIPGKGRYVFTKEDQGTHQFSLSTVFTKSGNNKIVAYEIEDGKINQNIKGVKNINVKEVKEQGANLNEKDLKITSPSNGTRIGNNSIYLSGKGTPFTDLKIYLNERKVGDMVAVNGDGDFSANISGLKEGENLLHVTENQGGKRSSTSIKVSIDTSAPLIANIEIYPKIIEVESNFNLKIYSEKGLSTIKALINGNIEILKEVVGTQGEYEVNILGPSEPGKYPVDIILSDSMGNKETYRNQGELEVKKQNIEPADKIEMIDATVSLNAIKLKWGTPNSKNKVKNYKIYLGESEDSIKEFGTSKINDINIEKLKFETQYFIGIKSENEFGKLSKMSDVKSIFIGKNPNKKMSAPIHYAPLKTKTKKDLLGFAGNGRITLKWKSLGKDSVKYKIEYGIDKEFMQESFVTKDNVNTWSVGDLINGLDYYFKVYGLDANGNQTSKESNILRLMPKGKSQVKYGGMVDKNSYKIDNIDKIVKTNAKTGPEIYFLLAIALLIGDFLHRKFFSRRKKY